MNFKKVLYPVIFLTAFMAVLLGCTPKMDEAKLDAYTKDQLNKWNKKLTDVIISDIFTPPVASRIYAYPHIAAYEALANGNPTYQSLEGQLREFEAVPKPEADKTYYFPVSGIIAFSKVGQHLVYNQEMLMDLETEFINKVKEIGIKKKVLDNSVQFGEKMAQHIIKWASQDGYIDRQALPRYVLLDEPGKWIPTPPDYMPGIEPHWNTLRTFIMDSVNQFTPPPPTKFDTAKNSLFYQECLEVYETVNKLDDERMEIAKFWDCNPNISFTKGHVMFYHQQISPGGHWMSIASIASQMKDADLMKRSEAFTITAIALYDAFISCWDEKYRSNLIRPETYIDRYIDPDWQPVLQTPAFPEYTSGHSVISSSAAIALTHVFGDNFAFADSSEVDYGLPVRNYDSFIDASNEAAISRLYGGIHYRPAIEDGVAQGRKVGQLVIDKLITQSDAQAAR